MIVIGGGVIGLELGSVYGRLGSKVTVIEFQDGLIPTMDKTLGKELMKILKKEGFKFLFNHAVQKVTSTKDNVLLEVKNKKGEIITVEGDYCLVAVGRKAYTDQLGLENTSIETDQAGRVVTNDNLQTKASNIYAIGDVVKGAMLAHKAEEEGVYVAELIANQKPHLNYNLIPGVVYTWPEVAAVGKTEEELKNENVDYKVGQFPIRALGRARASMDIQGVIKIISDSDTDEVLGVHMIAPRAADLIMEAVVAMEYRASAEDIARICHPHPTYSEAVKEAALAATAKRPLHI
jgi:dihydrolipoamide dehydrogenase